MNERPNQPPTQRPMGGNAMPDPTSALTLQLLEWIADRPRPYAEVLEAWRTACPRLSIWEDACIDGLIDCDQSHGRIVLLSPKGQALLQSHRVSSCRLKMPEEPNNT
jgi:hypothetical protein